MTKENLERNTKSPWVHVSERMPETVFPNSGTPNVSETKSR